MIINSITLKNFRSYEDETTFSFAPVGDKNIVLIGGENGAGKSTLFEAIKLCIYGPTTYGYIGQNSNYLTKIKNNINNNAFKNEDIECFIKLNISFKDGTEIKEYTLKRSWTYESQRIHENFEISLNDKLLNEEEELYFDKYLKSVIPPSLFNFFFFDGEELSEFFTGKSANSNLKESILELFNFDTFEILKKQLLSYQRAQSKSNSKLEEAQKSFDENSSACKKFKEEIKEIEETIVTNEQHLDDLLIKKEDAEQSFRNSGGIFEEEREALNAQINKIENERLEINISIKDFCNDTLPFLLVDDLLDKTKKQMKDEEALVSYNIMKDKLSGDVIENSLLQNDITASVNKTVYSNIADSILKNIFNYEEIKQIENILQLSQEDASSINVTVDNILNNKDTLADEIIGKFNTHRKLSDELKITKDKLNSTISGDLLNNYLEKINIINNEINEVQSMIAIAKTNLEHKSAELQQREYHLTRAKNEYTALRQNSNILDMSNDIIDYLNELLLTLTKDKITIIQDEFINIFSKIIRKDNYVNSIVIDDHFASTLYINKDYTTTDILNIINNLGFDGLVKKYGAKFLEDLFKYYNVETNKEVEEKVSQDISFNYITLSTKVNINDFSSGEKQVYILCLIWAIIKGSGVEIPFIIDTPYARIDESHRNALTTTYLPNISKQVIILSTNKEIEGELYDVIKPYVCDEYLLLYNTELRKTEVKNGYFEV